MLTVGLLGVGDGETRSPSGVFLRGDGFHVVWVAAQAVTAQVIDFQIGVNGSFLEHIQDPVWGKVAFLSFHADSDVPVALAGDCPCPF